MQQLLQSLWLWLTLMMWKTLILKWSLNSQKFIHDLISWSCGSYGTDNETQADEEEIFTLEDIMNHLIKKHRKRDKTVGVEINDVSETTTSIKETDLSDNSDNNAAIVAELVAHPNDVENI